jgi:hypothetical protein
LPVMSNYARPRSIMTMMMMTRMRTTVPIPIYTVHSSPRWAQSKSEKSGLNPATLRTLGL